MKRRVTIGMLLVVLCACGSYCVLLWTDYASYQQDLERLQGEVSQLSDSSAETAAARKARADLQELEQLKQNHRALGDLALRLSGLRKAQAQRDAAKEKESTEKVRKLQAENAQIRDQVEQLK